MRARTWLVPSVGLNLFLAIVLISQRSKPHEAAAETAALEEASSNAPQIQLKTNVVVRMKNFTWHEVESDDYATYIKNLREIGCPESTIRDIIVADVDLLYAFRRAEEASRNDFQWWRSAPDPRAVQYTAAKLKQLEDERRALLTKLLGPNWESREPATMLADQTGVNLAGPVLGDLSAEAKRKVYAIVARANQSRDLYLQQQRGLAAPLDPVEMGRLRREMRAELAQVLNPEQMEEFLLRYSQTAQDMRKEFRELDLKADEFRAIFRARDAAEQEKALLVSAEDAASRARLAMLQTYVEEALKRQLGTDRYTEFKLNQDPLFRQTKTISELLGASPEVMHSMYEINQLTQAERERIRNDLNLSAEQRIEALAAVQVEQQKSLERLLGSENFQKWMDLQERRR